MNLDCSRTLGEMALFADLGTEVAQGEQTRDGFVVRLYRNGDELKLVFADDGSGKVVERCRGSKPRTHASYVALLASERFGDLRRWASTQAMLLKETLAEIDPGIRVQGTLAGSDEALSADQLDGFLHTGANGSDFVQLMLIDGPAGIGKTKFIEALAFARAQNYARQRHSLVLHVQSRGRVLSYLQDLIAFSLQRLRLSVTFDQLPVLARHGLVTLAIDGFDELGDPNGYELAWSQVNQTIDDLRGTGTLILAGRETFIGLGRLKSALPVLQERDIVHGLTLRPPSPMDAEHWLRKKGWSKDDVEKTRDLLDPDSYALRPFFLARLAETDLAQSIRESPSTSLLPLLIDLTIDRESQKFGDAVESVLNNEERRLYTHHLLREIAQYMADDQTDIIGETPLPWLVDMALPKEVDADTTGLLKNRAGVTAFLTIDALPSYRRFAHSQLFNYFLSAAAIHSVGEGTIPKYVRRNIFSADFLAVFTEVLRHIASTDPSRIKRFFSRSLQWVENYQSIDRGARNLGAWIISALPTMEDITDKRETLRIGPLDVDETVLRGTAPPTLLRRVVVNQIDVRGTDLAELTFEDSALTSAIVDDRTRVSCTFPVPKRIRLQNAEVDHPTEDIWDPALIARWLDLHGRATRMDDHEQMPNGRLDEMLRLLGRACRSPTFWIPEGKGQTHVDKFVNDPLWPTVLELLRSHDYLREKRMGVSGPRPRFVHIKQPHRILANDPNDDNVARFYEALAVAAENA